MTRCRPILLKLLTPGVLALLVPVSSSASIWAPGADGTLIEMVTAVDGTGVDFTSAGIGDADELPALAANYNTQLIFALKGSGAYLAGVKVDVRDAAGRQILDVESPGPRFFATLPHGNYRITASYRDRPVHKTISVHELQRRSAVFYWDAE